ncbi:hypothetical protein ABT274_00005, partial [Streptomyces sp. NPDC001127]
MRILVLGGTGYLGRHVAARLRALPGARILAAGRSATAEFGVDIAADPVERLAKTLAAGAPPPPGDGPGAGGGAPRGQGGATPPRPP